jgi:hypothetical protein
MDIAGTKALKERLGASVAENQAPLARAGVLEDDRLDLGLRSP